MAGPKVQPDILENLSPEKICMQEIVSCGPRPQQIMGGLWPQEIFGWPKSPARYLLLALRASKRLINGSYVKTIVNILDNLTVLPVMNARDS